MKNEMKKLKSYSTAIAIAALYFFLIAGGLWQVLGVFQTLMRILAAPLLIALSIIALAVTFKILSDQKIRLRLLGWSVLVIIASFLIEWLGVKTGRIFGHYTYGETLQPILLGVPIAIGFAWLCMLLTSTAVVQRILPKFSNYHFLLQAISISLLMVLFDIVMEPAAMKLGYWTWQNGSIPLLNFIAWFGISFIFAVIGLRMRLFHAKLPAIVFHAYFAQLVYFGMVILK